MGDIFAVGSHERVEKGTVCCSALHHGENIKHLRENDLAAVGEPEKSRSTSVNSPKGLCFTFFYCCFFFLTALMKMFNRDSSNSVSRVLLKWCGKHSDGAAKGKKETV